MRTIIHKTSSDINNFELKKTESYIVMWKGHKKTGTLQSVVKKNDLWFLLEQLHVTLDKT